MAMSAAVYWPACTRVGPQGGPCTPIHVTNALATVARKSHALVRQASGVAAGRAGSTGENAPSGEGVNEGGGESVESGGKLGIDGSNVGLQSKLAPRKGFVGSELGYRLAQARIF